MNTEFVVSPINNLHTMSSEFGPTLRPQMYTNENFEKWCGVCGDKVEFFGRCNCCDRDFCFKHLTESQEVCVYCESMCTKANPSTYIHVDPVCAGCFKRRDFRDCGEVISEKMAEYQDFGLTLTSHRWDKKLLRLDKADEFTKTIVCSNCFYFPRIPGEHFKKDLWMTPSTWEKKREELEFHEPLVKSAARE